MIICAAAMVYWFCNWNYDDNGEENQDTTAHFSNKSALTLNKIQGYTRYL
jgi:hypothetical protein